MEAQGTAQTEARAFRAVDETGDFVMSIDDIATALSAKDAELAAVKVSNNKWLAKWERAEAQLAAQQCGREPDAYEVRCTDGNYGWRRPYHGELEVIMRTGRDRSGKPFEYRALYAAVPPLTAQPAAPEGFCYRDENGQVQFQQTAPEGRQEAVAAPKARRLAEMAMDFLHHDADQETYDRHVEALTKKFARLTRGPADPANRPAEQAVTDEMVDAACEAFGLHERKHGLDHRQAGMRAALKAAMEAGRQALASSGVTDET